MADQSNCSQRIRRLVAGVTIGVGCACIGVRAELISTYFPDGVPGFGTAPGVTVASRARPEFDAPGLRAGSFVFHPELDESLGYDSNVLGNGQSPRGSWVVGTHPSLLIGSDWSRNSVGAYLGVDDERYLDLPGQSYTNWTASLGGSLSIGRDQLALSGSHFSLHQPRTDLDAVPSDAPVAYQVDVVRAAYTISLGRVSLTPGIQFSAYHYDSTTVFGVPTSQAYRDRDVIQGDVTARYELSSQRNLLAVTRIFGSHYTEPQAGTPTLNSTSYEVLVGMSDDADPVWRYHVLLGWEVRAFDAAQYQTHQAPIVEAAVSWNPSGMTTVTGLLTRSIEDAAQEGISGYTYTSAKVAVDHEYMRNILLHGSVGLQHADFLQGGGQANSLSLGAGATWLINRNLRLSATYDFTDQRGTNTSTLQTTGNYTRSIGLLTLRVGM
jgi:hypothetical protein